MQKKVDILGNPSPLSKSVDVLRRSCLLVACKRSWPPFPCHLLWRVQVVLIHLFQSHGPAGHMHVFWPAHVSCRLKMAQRNGWKMYLGKKTLTSKNASCALFQKPLAWISKRAPSSLLAVRAIILSSVSGWSAGLVATLCHTSVRSEAVMSPISF